MKSKDVLRLVEHICYEHEERLQEDRDGALIMRIYRAVHAHLEIHNCHSNHKLWRQMSEVELANYEQKE